MKYIKGFTEAIRFKEKEKKKKKKTDPYYILTYHYMIGDSNGYTKSKVNISKDNPYLERYYKLLNSIKPVSGRWGVMLEDEVMYKAYKEGQITEDDYKFLIRMMFEDYSDSGNEYIVSPVENEVYANEFFEGVRSHSEYSYLVFQGVSLKYVDENGNKHEMEVD